MDDLISRQAVLDELENWDCQELYLPIHFKQILDDVPSVENKGEWIPVSERLPYYNMRVLVCDDCEDVMQSFLDNDGRFLDTWGEEIKNVLAWQPLPEPYQKGGEV